MVVLLNKGRDEFSRPIFLEPKSGDEFIDISLTPSFYDGERPDKNSLMKRNSQKYLMSDLKEYVDEELVFIYELLDDSSGDIRKFIMDLKGELQTDFYIALPKGFSLHHGWYEVIERVFDRDGYGIMKIVEVAFDNLPDDDNTVLIN